MAPGLRARYIRFQEALVQSGRFIHLQGRIVYWVVIGTHSDITT